MSDIVQRVLDQHIKKTTISMLIGYHPDTTSVISYAKFWLGLKQEVSNFLLGAPSDWFNQREKVH